MLFSCFILFLPIPVLYLISLEHDTVEPSIKTTLGTNINGRNRGVAIPGANEKVKITLAIKDIW